MTVRLLAAYGQYPINAIVTLDAGTEAGLVAAKLADTNTAGGVAYVAPVAPNQRYPALVEVDPSGATTGIVGADGKVISLGVNASDIGFDIVLCAGQSNMAGRGTLDTMIDMADSRVWQFGGTSGQSLYRQIFSGADPLHMPEKVETGLVGPATAFGRAYAASIPTNRRVLLVPAAFGGTSIVGGTPRWNAGNPGGDLYENAITQSNLAIAAALALFPKSRFVGTIWAQGETDGDNSVSQSAYATALEAVIAGFRARITGAANSWFIIGGMCPEVIASFPSKYPAIVAAHQQVASETPRCAYVPGPTGFKLDTFHYNADGARVLGARLALAVNNAVKGTPVDTPGEVNPPQSSNVYTFESDTVDAAPAGVTVRAGTMEVENAGVSGWTGKYAHFTTNTPSAGVGVFATSLDLIPDAADRTVTWKRGASTTGTARDGMVLRATAGSVTNYSSARRGYAFQTSGQTGDLRLYRMDASGPVQLGSSYALADATSRYYRASCIGTTIKFEFSNDGASWTTAISVTDSTYASGGVDYINGFSSTALSNAYIDDVAWS